MVRITRAATTRRMALLAALSVLAVACGGGDDDDGASDASGGSAIDTSGASGSPAIDGSESSSQDRIVFAVPSEPDDLDPFSPEVNRVELQVFEPLVKFNTEGETVPHLAAELPEQIDELTWEVKLREGVTFSDGTPMTAELAVEAFDLLVAEGNEVAQFPQAWYESSEVVDDLTIRLNLTTPAPLLVEELTRPVIVQPENRNPQNPVGTGPYVLAEWNRGQSMVFERRNDYWGPEPDVDVVEYRFIPDRSTQIAAFMAGEVDVLTGLSADEITQLPEENIASTESGQFETIVLNTLTGITADVRVRQAMNYAVDREVINEQFFGGRGQIIPGHLAKEGYVGFNPDLEPWSFDPERARELIREAGAEGASIEILSADGQWPADREQTEAVAAMWNDVGLNVTTRHVNFEEYLERFFDQSSAEARPQAFHVRRSTSVRDATNDGPYFTTPVSGVEVPSSVPPEVADEFQELATISDLEERDAAFQEFWAKHYDQAYFVHLVNSPILWAHSDRIADLNLVPFVHEKLADEVVRIELAD